MASALTTFPVLPNTANRTESTVTWADRIFWGFARDSGGPAQASPGATSSNQYHSGKRGIAMAHIYPHEYGPIGAGTSTGLVAAFVATATGGGALSVTGSLAATGLPMSFDVPRCVNITATGDVSACPVSIVGTDVLGRVLKAIQTGPTGNLTTTGIVAFKTVTALSITGALSPAISVGSSNSIQFPFRVDNTGTVICVSQDGTPGATGLTIVTAALATTTVATATTTDVLGFWTPNNAPNGTINWTSLQVVNHTTDTLAFGATPFAGP